MFQSMPTYAPCHHHIQHAHGSLHAQGSGVVHTNICMENNVDIWPKICHVDGLEALHKGVAAMEHALQALHCATLQVFGHIQMHAIIQLICIIYVQRQIRGPHSWSCRRQANHVVCSQACTEIVHPTKALPDILDSCTNWPESKHATLNFTCYQQKA